MTAPMIDPTRVNLFITSTGYVGLECDDLGADDQLALFGPEGVCPPRAFDDLLDILLAQIEKTPAPHDAERLGRFVQMLEHALFKTKTAAGRIEAP